MIKKYYKKLKEHFKEVLRIKKTPHSIALGFSIGTLIAILPTFGLGILFGLITLMIFKSASKVSMMISFAVWNPLVLFSLYGVGYKIGDWILGDAPIRVYRIELINELFVYSRKFLVGNFVLAVTFSILSYIILFYLTRWYQKTHPIDKVIEIASEIEKEIKEVISDS